MQLRQLLLVAVFAASAALGLSGCDSDDGPAEQMGQALDDTGEEIQDTATDAGNAVEDACEDVREGVDADDTDC